MAGLSESGRSMERAFLTHTTPSTHSTPTTPTTPTTHYNRA